MVRLGKWEGGRGKNPSGCGWWGWGGEPMVVGKECPGRTMPQTSPPVGPKGKGEGRREGKGEGQRK